MLYKPDRDTVAGVVGRFQTPVLSEGHKSLLKYAIDNHRKTLIFIGVHPTFGSRENPLDFQTRKLMLENYLTVNHPLGHEYTILPIKDTRENIAWSHDLDKLINSTYPFESVVLYGGRDSFVNNYFGKCQALDIDVLLNIKSLSSTELRKEIGNQIPFTTGDFRAGIVYSTQRRYDITFPVVDIVLMQKNNIFLGRKLGESKFRFFGGFVDANIDSSYEAAAKRELFEESGNNEVSNPIYLGSCVVNDWRYSKKDKLMSSIYFCELLWGNPSPNDDINSIEKLEYNYQVLKNILVEEHLPILDILNKYILEKNSSD